MEKEIAMKYLKYLIYTIGTISAITVVVGFIPALAAIIASVQTEGIVWGEFLAFWFVCLCIQAIFGDM